MQARVNYQSVSSVGRRHMYQSSQNSQHCPWIFVDQYKHVDLNYGPQFL